MLPENDTELHNAVKGVHVDIRGQDGSTALMIAASRRQIEAMVILLNNGADINAQDDEGETALTWAANYHGDPEIFHFLLERGADVNHQTEYGYTALMLAAFGDHIEGVKMLLKHKADIHLMNEAGLTALAIVEIFGETEIIQEVLRQANIIQIKTMI